jgi:predicted RNase H-like HicB family nuclease
LNFFYCGDKYIYVFITTVEIAMEGYGSRAVAAITGLSQRQIDYWDRTHFIKPSLAMSSGKGTRRLYDFMDLVRFRVAASLREKGISLRKIRKCVKFLRQNKERLERPLSSLKFLTDGDSLFILTADRKVVMDTLRDGQLVFSIAIGPLLSDLKGRIKEVEKEKTFTVDVRNRRYSVILHHDKEEGGFWAECPELPGCLSQGETIEEALMMIRDAIRGHLAVLEKVPSRCKVV